MATLTEIQVDPVLDILDEFRSGGLTLKEALSETWNLPTNLGYSVGDLRLQSGHSLVYKIPMSSESSGEGGASIALPDSFTKRAVKNIVCIKGWVLRASEPFHNVYRKKDSKAGGAKITRTDWQTWRKPEVSEGDGIIYTGFNRGAVTIPGSTLRLVFVREIDIEAKFALDDEAQVELSDWALTRGGVK